MNPPVEEQERAPLLGEMREPLAIDATCPIPKPAAGRLQMVPTTLIRIGQTSYTCHGVIDPGMPPVTWTREEVHPEVIADLQAWAAKKEQRLETKREAQIRAVASQVSLVRCEGYSKLREVWIYPEGGKPFPPVGRSLSVAEAVELAHHVRRFLVKLAYPDLPLWHLNEVLNAMRAEDLAEHVEPPL